MKSTRFRITDQDRSAFTLLPPQQAGENASESEAVFHHQDHRDWIYGLSFWLHEAAGPRLARQAGDP
jgi:hypothetical protein